jgi:uncharacterized protein
MADTLVDLYRSKLTDIVFSTVASPGAVASADYVESGRADMTFTQSDIAYIAFSNGTETMARPHTKLRGMAVLYVAAVQLLVKSDQDFRDLKDLVGKRIGVGPHGSSTEATVRFLLPQFGIPLSNVHLNSLPFANIPGQLADGSLDAEFVITSFPSPVVTAGIAAGTRLVPIQGPAISNVRKQYPFLRPVVIPAGTYDRRGDVPTLGVGTVFICRDDLSTDIVYRMLKVFFDSIVELAEVQPALRTITFKEAAATPIPLHAGAARFYREQELFR